MNETLKNMYKLLIDDSLSESFKDYIYEEMLKLVMEIQVNDGIVPRCTACLLVYEYNSSGIYINVF